MYKLDENVLVWIVLVALENKEHTKSTQRAFKVASIYIPRKQPKLIDNYDVAPRSGRKAVWSRKIKIFKNPQCGAEK